ERDVLMACAERLAPFKQPKRVILVDGLPKNPSGKVLKRELRLQHAGLCADDVLSSTETVILSK
ncbi:MAG: hypothetical protein ABW110_06650, partial [Steroidobacteraceae bacterium]